MHVTVPADCTRKTRRIDIVQGKGVQWDMVGMTLLDDKDGTKTPAIARKHGNDAKPGHFGLLAIGGRYIYLTAHGGDYWCAKGVLCGTS